MQSVARIIPWESKITGNSLFFQTSGAPHYSKDAALMKEAMATKDHPPKEGGKKQNKKKLYNTMSSSSSCEMF